MSSGRYTVGRRSNRYIRPEAVAQPLTMRDLQVVSRAFGFRDVEELVESLIGLGGLGGRISTRNEASRDSPTGPAPVSVPRSTDPVGADSTASAFGRNGPTFGAQVVDRVVRRYA